MGPEWLISYESLMWFSLLLLRCYLNCQLSIAHSTFRLSLTILISHRISVTALLVVAFLKCVTTGATFYNGKLTNWYSKRLHFITNKPNSLKMDVAKCS